MDSDDSDAPTGPSRAQKGKTRAIVSSSDSEPDDAPRHSKSNQLPPGRAVQTNGPRVAFNAQSKAKGQAIISGLNDRSAAKNQEQTGSGGEASRGGTPAVTQNGSAGGVEEAMQVDGQQEEEEEEEDFATGMAEKGGKKRKVGDVSHFRPMDLQRCRADSQLRLDLHRLGS